MFMFKVFAAIAVALATSTHCAPNFPAKRQDVYTCNGTDIQLSKIVNLKLYLLSSTIQGNPCESMTFSSTDNDSGIIIDHNSVGTENYNWTNYDHGCFKFAVDEDYPENYMVFKSFSEEPTYKIAVIYDVPFPDDDPNYYVAIIAASVNNIPQAKLDALQQETIAADPNLSNATFYATSQSDCTK